MTQIVATGWDSPHVQGKLHAGFYNLASITDVAFMSCMAKYAATIEKTFPQINLARIIVPEESSKPLAFELAALGLLEYVNAIPAGKYHTFTPNDPDLASEWHVAQMNLPAAWFYTQGDPSVIIGQTDTGYDLSHPDRPINITNPINWPYGGSVQDVYGHGTETSGTILGAFNNATGIAGVAGNCTLMPQVVDETDGTQVEFYLIEAVLNMADNGCKIITMSFELFEIDFGAQAAMNYAASKDVMLFASAGNDGRNSLPWPAAFDNVIPVASMSQGLSWSSFNNYAAKVQIGGPGESIFTPELGGGYTSVAGTSFSCPIVAGVAALIRSVNPHLNAANTLAILLETATAIAPDARFPNIVGYPNAGAAVQAAQFKLQSSFWIK